MSANNVGSETGMASTAIDHLLADVQLLRRHRNVAHYSPRVDQKLSFYFRREDLKSVVSIRLSRVEGFVLAGVESPVPHEFFSVADQRDIWAHRFKLRRKITRWLGINHLASPWCGKNTRAPATLPLAARPR